MRTGRSFGKGDVIHGNACEPDNRGNSFRELIA